MSSSKQLLVLFIKIPFFSVCTYIYIRMAAIIVHQALGSAAHGAGHTAHMSVGNATKDFAGEEAGEHYVAPSIKSAIHGGNAKTRGRRKHSYRRRSRRPRRKRPYLRRTRTKRKSVFRREGRRRNSRGTRRRHRGGNAR